MSKIQYGDACIESVNWAKKETYLDKIFTDFSKLPLNDPMSEGTRQELELIQTYVQALSDNGILKKQYSFFDQQFLNYLNSFKFIDDDTIISVYKEIIFELFQDALPLVHKLKLHFNRPRPFQLAPLHGLTINPHSSLSANCPAYPSLHSCMGFLIQEVCGNRFPQYYQFFTDIAEDLYHSRVAYGVCLPSDIDAGRMLAQKIIQDKEFKIKYRI